MVPSDFYGNWVENVWLGECRVKGLDIFATRVQGWSSGVKIGQPTCPGCSLALHNIILFFISQTPSEHDSQIYKHT